MISGIQYNELTAKVAEQRQLYVKEKEVLESLIRSEKSKTEKTKWQIDVDNGRNIRYATLLREAWSVLFRDLKKDYPDSEVERLKKSTEAAVVKLHQAEKQLKTYHSNVKIWEWKLERFEEARNSWKLYGLNDMGNYGKDLPSWAVAARVKVLISRTNAVIEPGKQHPGVEFVNKDKLESSSYDSYYKITHPLKYKDIKNRLTVASKYWAQYLDATRELESASAPFGYKLVTRHSTLSEIQSKLQGNVNSLKNEADRLEKSYKEAQKYNHVINQISTEDKLFTTCNLDIVVKNLDKLSWIKYYIAKSLEYDEAEKVVNQSVSPKFFSSLVRTNQNLSSETDAVKQQRIKVETERERLEKTERELLEIERDLRKQYPVMTALHPCLNQGIDIDKVDAHPLNLRSLPYLIGSPDKRPERFVAWQTPKEGNRSRFNYNLRPLKAEDRYVFSNLIAALDITVCSIINSFKPGNIKLTFVDIEKKGLHKHLFNPLIDAGLASVIINSDLKDLENKIQELQKKTESIYNSLTAHSNIFEAYNSGALEPDYELVVIIGPEYLSCDKKLKNLIEKGADYGIFFLGVALSDNAPVGSDFVSSYLTDLYIDTSVLYPESSRSEGPERLLEKVCHNVANEYSKNKDKAVRWKEADTLIEEFERKLKSGNKIWADSTNGLSVPIGLRTDSRELDYYTFNPGKFQHLSLIIGQTGSGKSVLLHDIITNLMLKYSPQQVNLHLMDFKNSGLEFKDYVGAPHVRTLLLDGSDLEMAAAIMSKLMKEIENTSRRLGSYRSIMDYNRDHPDDPIPFNIFIVDECHLLFKNINEKPKAAQKISDIIGYIAQQGRATGVGFILATQTRIGLQFPKNAESQLNNVFMLKCSEEDAQNLFPRDKIEVPPYHVFHKDPEGHAALSKVFINSGAVIEKGKEREIPYTQLLRGKGVFTAKDQFCYDRGVVRHLSENIVKKGYEQFDRMSPVLSLGHKLDVDYSDLPLEMTANVMNGNLLVAGLNQEGQTDRIMLNWMWGLSTYNPSNAIVYILNGNNSGLYATNLKTRIEQFKNNQICRYKIGNTVHQNKDLIEELYTEYLRRKAIGRMGDEDVEHTPIVVGVMNNNLLISSLYATDKFNITKPDSSKQSEKAANMNESDLDLLNRINAQRTDIVDANITSYSPFRKIGTTGSFGNHSSESSQEISYGEAYAQMISEGSPYHIHFVIQKTDTGAQFVPDFASRFARVKLEETFMSRIIVSHNDLSLERTEVTLDPDINHLRVYFQERADKEPEVMVPYVIK